MGLVATTVPVRRGYAISRIEAPPTAAPARNPPPPNVSSARADNCSTSTDTSRSGGGYKPNGDNKQQDNGGAGRGSDGGGVEGGRGRRRRGGKGRKTTSAPSGGLDRKSSSPRPAHHQQQQQQPQQQRSLRVHQDPAGGEQAVLEGHKTTKEPAETSGGGLGHRGHYHHEHDDRDQAPPPPADRKPKNHARHSSSCIFENGAYPSRPRADTHGKPAHARGRGSFTGDGNDRGGAGIFSRLGSPVISPGVGGDGRTGLNPKDKYNDINANNNGGGSGSRGILSRLGSPPPSPRNALSRADGSRDRHSKGRGRGAYRPQDKTTTTTTTTTGETSSGSIRGAAGREIPQAAVREPLPRPPRDPAAATAKTATTTKKDHQPQQAQREAASSAATAVNGRSSGGPFSSSRVVNHADRYSYTSTGRQRGGDANYHGEPGGLSSAWRGSTIARAAAVPTATATATASKARDKRHQPQRHHQHAQNQQQDRRKGDSSYARGTCMSMCPDSERRDREAEGGLSSFEATEATSKASVPFRQRVADPEKTVKKYRRSAAGRDMHRYNRTTHPFVS